MTNAAIEHPNVDTLFTIYSDLSCIAEYVSDNVILHAADRSGSSGPTQIVGKAAVLAKELDLIRSTQNTLVMEVHNIIANDSFGAVLGTLRAELKGKTIGVPFCGLWRFHDGLIVEHWENAYDTGALGAFFQTEDKMTQQKSRS